MTSLIKILLIVAGIFKSVHAAFAWKFSKDAKRKKALEEQTNEVKDAVESDDPAELIRVLGKRKRLRRN